MSSQDGEVRHNYTDANVLNMAFSLLLLSINLNRLSTGMREKIQLSQETADLLSKSGRSHWIKPRDNGVEAKGKGILPTFWPFFYFPF